MKSQIKYSFLFMFFLSSWCYAQDLSIASSESLTVTNGTIFYVNGLGLTPSSNFTISGANAITKTSTALNSQSIDRVFNFDNLVNGFQGELTFFYDDAELNGVTESDLVLQVKDGVNTWNSYTGTLNTTDNTLTFIFGSSIDFSSVTASASGVTLAIKDFAKLDLQIYPNPVSSSIFINTKLNIEINIYNAIGQLVLKSSEKSIDISQLSKGSYFFIIKDLSTSNLNSYKIVKI